MASRDENGNNQSRDASFGNIAEDDLEEDYYLVLNIPRDVSVPPFFGTIHKSQMTLSLLKGVG
jgi:hypothetical protein